MTYFPQGVATDSAFCNRERERSALRASIESHEHTVLVAPRRYGKTSLITQVLKENSFPGTSIDFLFVLSQFEVNQHIAEGVSQVISQLLPSGQAAARQWVEKIKAMNPKLTFNFLGQKLEIGSQQSTEKTITELLLALDAFAQKAGQSCVLILDEFQQIGELNESHAIEAAIRHAVERSQRVSYIFCGSKRHLLNEMFSSKSRPLYHLCDLMTIDRIHSDSYQQFLDQLCQSHWQSSLATDASEEILSLTQNHPYYVNALCRHLWRMEEAPTLQSVRETWHDYVYRQSPWIVSDISGLTLNRKKVLTALAQSPSEGPMGHAFSKRAGLSASSIQKSLKALQDLDMVYKNAEGNFCVLDPAVLYFIQAGDLATS